MATKTTPNNRRLRDLFRVEPYEIPLLAIATYFAGWWFRNSYFDVFGINKSSFNVPDYTVFVHAFSIVYELLEMIWDRDYEYMKRMLLPLLFLILILALPVVARRLKQRDQTRADILRISSKALQVSRSSLYRLILWVILFFFIFYVAHETGRRLANEVLYDSRPIEILLHRDVQDGVDNRTKTWFNTLVTSSRAKSAGLIWRNSRETIVLISEDSNPREVIRIDNKYIMGIVYDLE